MLSCSKHNLGSDSTKIKRLYSESCPLDIYELYNTYIPFSQDTPVIQTKFWVGLYISLNFLFT